MIQSTKNIFGLLLLAFSIVACGENPAGERVAAGEAMETTTVQTDGAVTYVVNTNASEINWEGGKLVGDTHKGTIDLQQGELLVEDGNLQGGRFIIDMNSLSSVDLAEKPDAKAKLEGHLKTGDFFETEKYPTATFEITQVSPVSGREDATHEISGNLTMKEQTKSITFPARIEMQDNQLTASTPAFVVDRTQWNVMYGAGATGVAKDKIIKNDIGLQIDLQASPQQAGN